jgi:hypothetical protein
MQFKNALIIFLCGIIILFFSYKRSDDKNEKLSLEARIYSWDTARDLKYLTVNTSLKNNSSDTFTYIIESCFYPYEYTTDPKMFANEEIDCIKNIPEFVKIPPHQTIERMIRLQLKENIGQLRDSSFRIGVSITTADYLANELHRKKIRLIKFSSKESIFQLHDTSYKVSLDCNIIDGNNIFKQIVSTTNERLLWSNKINLK